MRILNSIICFLFGHKSNGYSWRFYSLNKPGKFVRSFICKRCGSIYSDNVESNHKDLLPNEHYDSMCEYEEEH